MGRLVNIKLCPFRAKTNAIMAQFQSSSSVEFEECYEEKCMMYDEKNKRCGLTHPAEETKK